MRFFRYLLPLFFCICTAHFGYSQANSDSLTEDAGLEYPVEYEGVLKTNPLSMLWGSIPLTAEYMGVFEFVTSPQQASQIGLSYITKSPILKAFEDTVPDLKLLTANGVRLQLSHRFFILKSRGYAPRGLYLSPQVSYATVKVSTKHFKSRDVYIRVTQFNTNLLGGWQWIFANNYSLDVFLGLGYKDNFFEQHEAQTTISLDNDDFGDWYAGSVRISVGFHVGIAF